LAALAHVWRSEKERCDCCGFFGVDGGGGGGGGGSDGGAGEGEARKAGLGDAGGGCFLREENALVISKSRCVSCVLSDSAVACDCCASNCCELGGSG
jgi:hypothetical protein